MGDEERLLYRAVQSALSRAEEVTAQSISLPAISTGIFGFPKELGVGIILQAVQDYLDSHPQSPLQLVRFCNIDEATARLFAQALQALV
jgi:putative ATPase